MKPAAANLLDATAEEVAAYLIQHPDFLANRPELYRALTPPRRVHGEGMADHMAAMIAAERARTRTLEGEVEAALKDGRAGATLVLRVRLAVLALMRARDVGETIAQELPALLSVESCTLLAERPGSAPGQGLSGAMPERRHEIERLFEGWGIRWLPDGSVNRLLGRGRDARVRTEVTDAPLLHAEAAPLISRDALLRVPLWYGTPCLLAIGARDAAALPARQAAATLAFLGRAVAAALAR